ncbi:hypothetical protein ACFQ0B_19525 [Nonomuraea thailandensis]
MPGLRAGFALWETGQLTAETTWNNKARWIRKLGETPALPHCSTPGPITIDVTDALLEALAAGRQEITFGLRSRDERDTHGHYVFEPSPELTLYYNRPPGAPTDLKTGSRRKQPTPCVSGDERPYLPDLSAIVWATVPDSAGGPVSARWQWETLAGETRREGDRRQLRPGDVRPRLRRRPGDRRRGLPLAGSGRGSLGRR